MGLSPMTLLNLAEAGAGVTILPRLLVEGSNRLSCAELDDDRFERRFYLIHHPQKYLTPALTDDIERLKT